MANDNREGWNAIADAYQRERGWPHESLYWGIRCPPETELGVLDPIAGRKVLVLGCGGGQDCVALCSMGAGHVVGIDSSERQLAHAEVRCRPHGPRIALRHGDVQHLDEPPDSYDLAVSVHVLSYVADVPECLRGVWRCLRPGGQLALSVHHPLDAITRDEPPYGFGQSYFQVETRWAWGSLGGADAPFTSYHRPISDWFRLLRAAGFTIENMLEPAPVELPIWRDSGWAGGPYYDKLATVPGTLILAARKPR
jgi:SAM-dependent methyltransferase